MKKYLITILLTISVFIAAQNSTSKFDIRLGSGISFLSSGDMTTSIYENELNYKLNPYLSNSLAIDFGRSNRGVYENVSLFQANFNGFISPFKNNLRNDFRIGVGLSFIDISKVYLQSTEFVNDQLVRQVFLIDMKNGLGVNLILENTFMINKRFFVGIKLFSQHYFKINTNSGVMLKCGMKI